MEPEEDTHISVLEDSDGRIVDYTTSNLFLAASKKRRISLGQPATRTSRTSKSKDSTTRRKSSGRASSKTNDDGETEKFPKHYKMAPFMMYRRHVQKMN